MHRFDHAELAAYLATHVDGFTTLDSIEKFGDGQSNPTYALSSGTRRFVLRARPPGKLLPSAHLVDREFRVMSALANTAVPVPEMMHLSDANSPMGTQFFVMEHVDGTIHWDPALPDQTPATRRAIYDAMNETLAALHSVDVNAAGLSDFGKPGNYYARQLSRWTGQYRAAETEPRADVDWIIDWLTDNMVTDDGAVAITHGDYRIDNMIFAPDGQMRALLDWELSTLGHPMADLAYQAMIWRLPNAGRFKGLGGVDRATLGLPSDADYIAAYCARRGLPEPAEWSFYLTFACFRFLAILQGVLRRGLDGNASNPLGRGLMNDLIDYLAKEGRAVSATA